MPDDRAARRASFPRGLVQPEHGFRFGADTLLLAAFAHSRLKPGAALRGLDLGCGCGAAALALLLLPGREPLDIAGIDRDAEMVAAAGHNAALLGLDERFGPALAEAAGYAHPARPLHFVLANPPFRTPGSGRACPHPGRNAARFETAGGFADFAACAARNLGQGGSLFLVHLAERLPQLFHLLAEAGLPPRRLLPVQGRRDKAPRLALVQAVRGRADALALEPPLVLYDAGQNLTPEAATFCPHLAVNPSRRSKG